MFCSQKRVNSNVKNKICVSEMVGVVLEKTDSAGGGGGKKGDRKTGRRDGTRESVSRLRCRSR